MVKFYLPTKKLFLFLMPALMAFHVNAQNTVSGVVKASDDGSSLPGVSIAIKGTSTGTFTDADGKYSISAPNDAVLVFSFIGYKAQEIAVNGRQTVDVTMETDVKTLQEVVVVGYGTQMKREVTGSISKVEGSKLLQTQAPSFEAALQ